MFDTWGDILMLPLMALILFLFWAALTPFETLGWWAGWFGEKIYYDDIPSDGVVRRPQSNACSYVIFLSGIGRVSGHTLSFREQEFLRRLARRLNCSVVIDDVFPYSVNNLALTGQPIFARLWRWALKRKVEGPALAGYLINIRNLFQVAISVDKRYAPIYNQAMAEVLLDSLLRYQYVPTSTTPIYVIGYSGAGQMAIGAVTYLREWVQAPVYVISLGGIFSSDPGLLAADHVYHLWGTRDKAQIWRYLMPGRWRFFAASEWNRGQRQGKITVIRMQDMGHTGRGGYLDHKEAPDGGIPYIDRTVETIAGIIEASASDPPLQAQPGEEPRTVERLT
ncbi:MAG: hypothetical protein H3C34_11690 [Caldilineaceae bacterium]|nr:hypothetical protein [Caldilineaceae bacterium]